MIEAQVICSCPCKIQDLGLDLERGQEVWLADETARGSLDLLREQAKGNVRVMRKSRRMDRRDPVRSHPPPFVALTRPQHRAPVEQPPEPRPEVVQGPPVDTDALAREVQMKIVEGLRPMIAEELGKALASQQQAEVAPAPAPAPAAQLDQAQLAGVLESVLRRVMPTGGAPGAAREVASEDPLYMPGKLVDKDAKAKIDVKQTSSDETSDLDDAAAALRKIKRGRGTTNEETDK
jgi:hypothetical protein